MFFFVVPVGDATVSTSAYRNICAEEKSFRTRMRMLPHDDVNKLVFADWLEEHDRPGPAERLRWWVGAHRALGDRVADYDAVDVPGPADAPNLAEVCSHPGPAWGRSLDVNWRVHKLYETVLLREALKRWILTRGAHDLKLTLDAFALVELRALDIAFDLERYAMSNVLCASKLITRSSLVSAAHTAVSYDPQYFMTDPTQLIAGAAGDMMVPPSATDADFRDGSLLMSVLTARTNAVLLLADELVRQFKVVLDETPFPV